MEIFIYALVGIIITYFLIRFSVEDAITKKMGAHLKIQSAILRHQAKQAGMTEEEIDRAWMNPKQLNRKYKEMKIKQTSLNQ